ncbi:MAG: hypothetical protein HDR20_02065 [Lachnospiraceae bacterium]|nr:hypothetical protein [Lachnospiraceae bacterium]
MKLLIIGIIIFLVVLYIYTFIKYKKRKNSHVSAVEEFKRKYHKKHVDDVNAQEDSVIIYKTKFNSDLDYIEPGQLIQECQEMKEPKPAKKFGKLQF